MGIQQLIATKLEPTVQVTDEAKHKFYAENQDKMQTPEQVRASHILIRVEQGATPEAKEAARQKAADLLAQIKGGADFATLAKASSQDPGSAVKGAISVSSRRAPWCRRSVRRRSRSESRQGLGAGRSRLRFHIIRSRSTRRRVPRRTTRCRRRSASTCTTAS
jgi:hypothetical protein